MNAGTGAPMALDDAVRHLRRRPEFATLVRDAYLGRDVRESAERFAGSGEFEELLRWTGEVRGLTVLDIGAGTGIASYAFARRGAVVVYALEPDESDEVGRGAIARLSHGLPIQALASIGERIPLGDGVVDLVYARQVLHHVADLPSALAECARVLRPGGRFIAAREHAAETDAERAAFLAAHPVHQLAGGENAYPLRAYRDAITGAGLTLEAVLDPWASVLNAFPFVRTQAALDALPRDALRRRFGPLGALLHTVPAVRRALLRRAIPPMAGGMHTFVARKPAPR